MRPNITTGQTNAWLLTLGLALALLVANDVGAQWTGETSIICSAVPTDPLASRSLPVAFYMPDFAGTSLNRVTIWFDQHQGAFGVFRLTVRSDTYEGPLIGTKTIDLVPLPFQGHVGREFHFEDPAIEPGSRVTFLLERVSGPGLVDILGSNNSDNSCGVIPTTTVPPLGDRLDDGWVPFSIIQGGALPTDQIRFECLPSLRALRDGDLVSRGFYVKEYNGTGLSRVEIWVNLFDSGHYQLRLTIRKDTYDGEVIGTATAEADLLGDHVTPLFFELGRRTVPYRSRLTFTLEKLSGPGPLYYMLARESCPGVVQTEGTNPPLDTPRFSGRSVGLRIWGDSSIPDLRARELEVTQTVQDLNGSVPLVAWKPTFVRFHVSSTPSPIPAVNAQLLTSRDQFFRTGVRSYRPLHGRITVLPSPRREETDDSFLFKLQRDDTAPIGQPLYLKASVDPDKEINADDERDAYTTGATRLFQFVPPMRLVVFRVAYQLGGRGYIASSEDVSQMIDWIRNAYPVSEVHYYERTLSWLGDGKPDCGWLDANLAAIKIANDIASIFGFNSFPPDAHYYAMVHDGGGAGFMRGCGVPFVASGPTGSIPGGANPNSASSWDEDGSYGDWYGGHEIGHTFGRLHPGKGNCTHTLDDKCYPYADGRISPVLTGKDAMYGFNGGQGPHFGIKVYGPEFTDVMTYCQKEWISDYTYEGLMNAILSGWPSLPCLVLAPPAAVAGGGAGNGERLVIAGSIDPETNEIHLVAPSRVPDVGEVEPRVPGDYRIDLIGGGGQTLAAYPFTPDQAQGGPGALQISEVVPYVPGTAEVRITGPGGLDHRLAAGSGVPVLRVVSPNGGEIVDGATERVSWSASDPDGDSLSFSVQYSPDGETWEMVAVDVKGSSVEIDASNLRTGDQARFRVTVTDGINSASDDSDGPFHVPNHLPEVEIQQPGADVAITVGDTLTLAGHGFDADDGSLLGDQLEWSSNLSGPLGTGSFLSPALAVGVHTITLRGRDTEGDLAFDSVRVTVVQNPDDLPPPPADGILVRPDHLAFDAARGERSALLLLSNRNPQRSIAWNASVGAPWLRLSTSSGATPGNVPVSFDETGLAHGVYQTEIVLESLDAPGQTVTVPVEAVVAPRESSVFLRGDCNGDGGVDISDAIQTLGVLFLGGGEFPCKDACDSNDDGRIDISDAINTLGVLFLGQGTIPLPGNQTCGVDPTGDDAQLTCESYSRCP